MPHSTRRLTAAIAALATTALVLTGCTVAGSTPEPIDTDKPVTLRMVWWGSDDRAAVTRDAIAAFEKKHPNITVEPESLPFDGYYDKLSTQIAANDAPDVQQLTTDYVIEYGSRGALLDLRDIDTTKIDTATTKAAQVEGKQLGVPTGIATLAIVANPTLFKQAGIEMPNDETWTWDEYAKIAQKISDNSPDGVYGSQALGTDANQIADWARQRGEDQWTEDGKLGLTVDTVAGFYEFAKKMVDSGAAPSADEASEQTGVGLEQTGTALNHYAMGYWATNQLSSLELVSKAGLELLRLPGTSGSKGDHKMAFGASQYWAAASRSKHPAEAQMLIDFLANSTEAGKLLLVGRGSPVNSDVREAVLPLLDESKAKIVDFVTEVQPETVAANVAPAGVSAFQDNMRRYTAEVYFNRMTPKEAAKGLLDETQASIK